MKKKMLAIGVGIIFGFLSLSKNIVYACEHPTINNNTVVTKINTTSGAALNEAALSNFATNHLGESFVNAGLKNQIDPIVLMAIAAYESGWGTSTLSKTHNNLFGIKHPTKKWSQFKSWESCIDWFANMFDRDYVDKGMNTLNKIQAVYCPDNKQWDENVANIANQIAHKIYCE